MNEDPLLKLFHGFTADTAMAADRPDRAAAVRGVYRAAGVRHGRRAHGELHGERNPQGPHGRGDRRTHLQPQGLQDTQRGKITL